MSDDNGPRLYTLARASTLKQAESPATQQEIMKAARETLGLPEPIQVEEPLATSGKTKFAMRPVGGFLMRTLRKGDYLMVTKLDRLGRNLRDIYDTVDALFQRGVGIIILHGWGGVMIDMRNAAHRMMLLILAWFAEYEREQIAARTKEGLDHRKRNGLSSGVKAFTYIQNYRADGTPITKGEYDKKRGDYKINEPDNAHLQQLCELLALQKSLGVNGKFLRDYCKERGFVNHAGERWWDVPIRTSGHGFWWSEPARSMKRVRRMAVAGDLPGDWNDKILAITGDTPVDVVPKWKAKSKRVRGSTVSCPTESDMEAWSAEEWRAFWKAQQQESP